MLPFDVFLDMAVQHEPMFDTTSEFPSLMTLFPRCLMTSDSMSAILLGEGWWD